MRTLAIIPAHGVSEGIPYKNIKHFCGYPLLAFTVEMANVSRIIDKVVVSTEDSQIAEVAEAYGVELLVRPQELVGNDVMVWEVIRHASNIYDDYDCYLELHTTYPLRSLKTIEGAIRHWKGSDADGCLCASPVFDRIWRKRKTGGFKRIASDIKIESRQHQEPLYLDHYGLCNVYSPNLAKQGNPYHGSLTFYPVEDTQEALDIDSEEDFALAETIMREKR